MTSRPPLRYLEEGNKMEQWLKSTVLMKSRIKICSYFLQKKLREPLVGNQVKEQLDRLTEILRKIHKSLIFKMNFRRATDRAKSRRKSVNEIPFSEKELVRVARMK
eukprot:snap_masked-scaffold_4-processed-gene-21.64-mRNA-1 protein AED:1.00 eAED:1.00 QI:0/-1/0/0/-1/1/1/0/105